METCPKVKSALLTIISEDGAINLLGIDNQLSAIADLPLKEVMNIALLSAKEFEVAYKTATRQIVKIMKY